MTDEAAAYGGTALEESDLIARAQRGDARAYETLVLRYQDVAFRTAYLITGDAQAAEDAVQEAMVKAYYALPRFRPGASLRPWLLRIVANEARNRRKADFRRISLTERAAADMYTAEAARSPEAEALQGEQRMALMAALSRLSEEDRLVICYRYLLSLSELEMATVMDCARGTVKSRLARALKRLRLEIDRPAQQEQEMPQDGPGVRSARHG